MWRVFRLHIEFPALDALVKYLVGREQTEIDGFSAQVKQATETLKQSTTSLDQAVQTQKGA